MPVITHKEALAVGKELGFSEDDVNLYKTQFDACDEDGGGSISSTELKSVFRACGMVMTDIEIERLVKEFDEDDTGDLDFGEFLHMMHKFQQGPSENEVRKAMFELLDENLDGLVSLQELMATWKRSAAESAGAVAVPPESELRQLFAQADQGKDGYLNDEEFFALCEAVYPTGVEKVEK